MDDAERIANLRLQLEAMAMAAVKMPEEDERLKWFREQIATLTRERDEALAALRGMLDRLSYCEHVDSNDVPDCTRAATRGYAGSDGGLCDGHAPEWMPDVPGADAIREAERVLGIRGKAGE